MRRIWTVISSQCVFLAGGKSSLIRPTVAEKKAPFPAALETELNERVITDKVSLMNGGFS